MEVNNKLMMNKAKENNAKRVFVALGANLGEPLQQLDAAVEALQKVPEINCLAMSKVYVSKPHGPQNQPDFTNAVLAIDTTLSPEQLLDVLQRIEIEQGRERHEHWGARTLDLDIILYANQTIQTERLTIPHAYAHEREFVLQPLADLDETLVLPQHGKITELLKQLPTETMEVIRDVTTYNR